MIFIDRLIKYIQNRKKCFKRLNLKSQFENINIIFIDFMDLAYEEIKEYHALHSYVEENYQAGKINYLCFIRY